MTFLPFCNLYSCQKALYYRFSKLTKKKSIGMYVRRVEHIADHHYRSNA